MQKENPMVDQDVVFRCKTYTSAAEFKRYCCCNQCIAVIR